MTSQREDASVGLVDAAVNVDAKICHRVEQRTNMTDNDVNKDCIIRLLYSK